jgi:hypothetical protein
MSNLRGSCLCEEVVFEIDGNVSPMEACHCSRCRKTSGSAFSTALLCATSSFRWVRGSKKITSFRLPSGFAHDFCSVCGSPTPGPTDEKVIGIPVGCLESDPGTRIKWHAFVASKAEWESIIGDARQFEEHADHSQ